MASASAGEGIRVFPWGWKVEMAEIFLGCAVIRQLSQFFAAVVFFHASEYALAIAFHGRSNVSLSCTSHLSPSLHLVPSLSQIIELRSYMHNAVQECQVIRYFFPSKDFRCLTLCFFFSFFLPPLKIASESENERDSVKALLISKQYIVAMGCALLEYMLEVILFPELKEYMWISNFGLVMVIVGELIRKVAVLTARHAFTHTIRTYHEDNHELITHGIYRFIRHPGYCGFFIWATGIQVMLCNPICIVAFAVVTWRFFSTRIQYEEFFLRQFFGSQYDEYVQQVPSGLPFVK